MDEHGGATRHGKRSRGQGRTADFPRLLGGVLCLDFVNTVEDPLGQRPADFLKSYDDLARWCHHAGALDAEASEQLRAAAVAHPEQAATLFSGALTLRAAIEAIFRRIARAEHPLQTDVLPVQRAHAEAIAHARLIATGEHFAWSWEPRGDDLRLPLWLIASSAVDLLASGDRRRIRVCPGAGDCGWLFYDRSRNGHRLWCSMDGCGSRVKMRRHYARAQAAERPGSRSAH